MRRIVRCAFTSTLLRISVVFHVKVNASPSLNAENPGDHELKMQLISDVLDVVDLEERLTGDEQRWVHSPPCACSY